MNGREAAGGRTTGTARGRRARGGCSARNAVAHDSAPPLLYIRCPFRLCDLAEAATAENPLSENAPGRVGAAGKTAAKRRPRKKRPETGSLRRQGSEASVAVLRRRPAGSRACRHPVGFALLGADTARPEKKKKRRSVRAGPSTSDGVRHAAAPGGPGGGGKSAEKARDCIFFVIFAV